MIKHEKVANIIVFLSLLFGEECEFIHILYFHPDYLIEKFERYIESTKIEYPCGMHPSLRNNVFQKYVDKWELELKND